MELRGLELWKPRAGLNHLDLLEFVLDHLGSLLASLERLLEASRGNKQALSVSALAGLGLCVCNGLVPALVDDLVYRLRDRVLGAQSQIFATLKLFSSGVSFFLVSVELLSRL